METRWHILILCCTISFSVDFFYDEPGPLVQHLTGASLSCQNGTDNSCTFLSMMEYNALFTGFSWASGITAVVVGFAIDRYGPDTPLWLSLGLLFAGSIMFAGGSYARTADRAYAWMLTGRILYGMGSGALITICHQIKAAWFMNKELAMSFALYIVAGRLGSALNFLISGAVVSQIGLSSSLWIGFAITLLACIAIVRLIYMEERYHDTSMPRNMESVGATLKGLDALYWSFAVAVFLFYGAALTFTANGVALLASLGASESSASYIVGIVYDICLLAPLMAYFLDRYGHRDWWITGSCSLLLLAFIIYMIPNCPFWVLSVFVGLAYAAFPPIVWSSLPLIVPQTSVGVANGLLKFFQYACVGLITLIAGSILDMNGGSNGSGRWMSFIILLLVIALLSLLMAVLINILNKKARYPLTPSQGVRKASLEVEEITPVNVDFGSGKGSGSISRHLGQSYGSRSSVNG